MRNAPEVVREVGVPDFRMATEQQLLHLYGGLLGVAPSAAGVDFRWKVGFEDRLQHQHRCCHADPIPHGRDAQRPEFAVGLRYEHASDRFRSVCLPPERKHQFSQPPPNPIRSMSAKSWPSTPGAPLLERRARAAPPGTTIPMLNALLVKRWQSVQWHL